MACGTSKHTCRNGVEAPGSELVLIDIILLVCSPDCMCYTSLSRPMIQVHGTDEATNVKGCTPVFLGRMSKHRHCYLIMDIPSCKIQSRCWPRVRARTRFAHRRVPLNYATSVRWIREVPRAFHSSDVRRKNGWMCMFGKDSCTWSMIAGANLLGTPQKTTSTSS